MTHAQRLRAALHTLHWPSTALALEARVSVRLVALWLAGDRPVPEPVLDAIEALAAFHAAHPFPSRVPREEKHAGHENNC